MLTRRVSFGSSLVLVAALALGAGCDKGNKAAGGGGGKGMAGASAVAPNGGLSRALSMMPANSEMVIAVDFKQVRASGLWKKYESKLMGSVGKELAEFKAVCGWDPIEKASGALAAGRGREMDELTVFVRGFDKASVIECIKKADAKFKGDPKGGTAIVDGDYVEFGKVSGDTDTVRFIFVDDQTILFQRVPGTDDLADKATLQKVLAAKDGEGLMSSATFSSLIDATDTGAAAWFVMNGNSAIMQNAGQMPFKFKAIFGSVTVDDGVNGVLKLRMEEEKDASGVASMAEMAMGQVAGTPFADFAKGVKISSKGKDLNVAFKFTAAQLDTLAAQAGTMF